MRIRVPQAQVHPLHARVVARLDRPAPRLPVVQVTVLEQGEGKMTASRWCVRVTPPEGGGDVVFEVFDDRRTAEMYYRTLQEDSPDNPVNVLHHLVLVVSLEEERPGWETLSRKLVMR